MTGILDRYRLGEAIGAGSFATVYRARDERLDAEVVVKVLAENHSLNPEVRERFIAEGRTLRRVAGPHVVAVHDIGESERHQPVLVLEYADRGSLAARVAALQSQGWTARPEDVLSVARPLAIALDSVHRRHLVHRDLSPGNILLISDGSGAHPAAAGDLPTAAGTPLRPGPGPAVVRAGERLLVADLGLCKDLALNSGLTVSGGTSGFRPPEQEGPGLVDARADIWAATALLAWLTVGAELPEAFERFLRQGMQPNPRRRPADISAWIAGLEAALAPAPPPASETGPDSGTEAGPDPAREGAGRRRPGLRAALAGGLALVVLLAGVVLGLVLGGDDRPASAADGARIAIEGPDRVRVGQSVTFTARAEGVNGWAWTLPTGTHLADEEQATLTATSAGTTEVVLRARLPGGPELEARHAVTVVD